MNIESGNVWNQFLVSSVLLSLYAVTKELSQIWGSPFLPGPSRTRGAAGPSSGSGYVFLHWSWCWFYYFQSREKSSHIDLGRRKSGDCTSCISNNFGVKFDRFYQWQFARTVHFFSDSTAWWNCCLNFSNFTLKGSFTSWRLFFIWSFTTLSRYLWKSWSSLDKEWWSASIFCWSVNSFCEISDSVPLFSLWDDRAGFAIIFWSSFNRTRFRKLPSVVLMHVCGTNCENRRAQG